MTVQTSPNSILKTFRMAYLAQKNTRENLPWHVNYSLQGTDPAINWRGLLLATCTH